MTLQIEIVPILSDNYVYLVRDEASGQVACVDPGEAAPVLAAAEENNVATLVSLMCRYFLLGQELRPQTDTDTQVPWHTG